MCITFSTSFVFLLLLFKNPWKIHMKIIIICHLHNILLVWISHPAIEWIESILFLVTFIVILCILFSGTCCGTFLVLVASPQYMPYQRRLYSEYMLMKANRPHNHGDFRHAKWILSSIQCRADWKIRANSMNDSIDLKIVF